MEKNLLYKTNIHNNKSNTFLNHKFSKNNRFEILNKKQNLDYVPKNITFSHNQISKPRFINKPENLQSKFKNKEEGKKSDQRSFKFVNAVFDNLNKDNKNRSNSNNLQKNKNYSGIYNNNNISDKFSSKIRNNINNQYDFNKILKKKMNKVNLTENQKKKQKNYSTLNPEKQKNKNGFFDKSEVINNKLYNSEKKEILTNLKKKNSLNQIFMDKNQMIKHFNNSEKKEHLLIRENLLTTPKKYNFKKRNERNTYTESKLNFSSNKRSTYTQSKKNVNDIKKNFKISYPINKNLIENKNGNEDKSNLNFSYPLKKNNENNYHQGNIYDEYNMKDEELIQISNFNKRNSYNQSNKINENKRNVKFSIPNNKINLKEPYKIANRNLNFSHPPNEINKFYTPRGSITHQRNSVRNKNFRSTKASFNLPLKLENSNSKNNMQVNFSFELGDSNKKIILFKTQRSKLFNKYMYMQKVVDFGDELYPSIYHKIAKNNLKKEIKKENTFERKKYRSCYNGRSSSPIPSKNLIKKKELKIKVDKFEKNKNENIKERKSTPVKKVNPLFMNFDDIMKKKRIDKMLQHEKFFKRNITK